MQQETLNRFSKNFVEENKWDSSFMVIVEALERGVDPYKVIETMFTNRKEMENKLEKTFEHIPLTITKND